jgi:hypothetical protein
MGRRARTARIALVATLTLLGAAIAAPAAYAPFHLMKVREVFPGSSGNSYNDAFIEQGAARARTTPPVPSRGGRGGP